MQNFGDFFCDILSRVAWILPNMPANLTLAALAVKLGGSIPFLGSQIIYELLSDISGLLTLAIGYKILKILPARF